MLIHQETQFLTPSSGVVVGNTRSISGVCYNILVKSTQESTIYDISLTNSSGIVVYSRTSETGTLSEITSLILKGIYTISISNATSDELFTIQLIIREN